MHDTTFLVDALAEILYSNLLETEDLGKHVEFCKDSIGNILVKSIEENMLRFDDELKFQVPSEWKNVDKRQRTIITLAGPITYHRRVYQDTYGNRRYLLDEVLGIAPYKRCDSQAFLWVVRKAADVSYQKVAHAFYELTGCMISRQTVMRLVHEECVC